jgi:[protein-PII] uridylyltransferase
MARSDWKIVLLTELYFKVRRILERGTLASPDATKKIETQKKRVLKELAPDFPEMDLYHLAEQVSSRYFIRTPLEDMVRHFRMALTLEDKRFSWVLEKLRDAPVTRVIMCIRDQPGLFSKMVGVFTLNNIRVLSANIFTLKNGLAFDVYEVTNPLDPYREAEKWEEIRREIQSVLDNGLALEELISEKERTALAPEKVWRVGSKHVVIDNEVSDFFTVVEVTAEGRLGMLYKLAKGFSSLSLDIRFAKVNRDEEKMGGSFYIRDADGQKVQGESRVKEIRERILSLLS